MEWLVWAMQQQHPLRPERTHAAVLVIVSYAGVLEQLAPRRNLGTDKRAELVRCAADSFHTCANNTLQGLRADRCPCRNRGETITCQLSRRAPGMCGSRQTTIAAAEHNHAPRSRTWLAPLGKGHTHGASICNILIFILKNERSRSKHRVKFLVRSAT